MPEPTTLDTGNALRALPLPAPPGSGWARLAASIEQQQRRRRQRWLLPAALAASLLLLLVTQSLSPPPSGDGTDAAIPFAAANDDAATLAALQAESARLDRAIEALDGSADSAEVTVLQVQIADRVAWIDALLAGAADDDPQAALALWSERVLLLRQLNRLQGRESWLLAASTLESATPMVSL